MMKSKRPARTASTILYVITSAVFICCSALLLFNGTTTGKKAMLLTVIAVTLPLLFATLLRGKSEDELCNKKRVIRSALFVLLAYYCIALVGLLFLGGRGDSQFANYNFVPFKSISAFVSELVTSDYSSTKTIAIDNLLGNLALFAPMAIFLPCLFSPFRRWRLFLPVIALIIIAVEFLQLAFRCGTCDIDDFMLNFAGAVTAYAFIRLPFVHRLLIKMHCMDV